MIKSQWINSSTHLIDLRSKSTMIVFLLLLDNSQLLLPLVFILLLTLLQIEQSLLNTLTYLLIISHNQSTYVINLRLEIISTFTQVSLMHLFRHITICYLFHLLSLIIQFVTYLSSHCWTCFFSRSQALFYQVLLFFLLSLNVLVLHISIHKQSLINRTFLLLISLPKQIVTFGVDDRCKGTLVVLLLVLNKVFKELFSVVPF